MFNALRILFLLLALLLSGVPQAFAYATRGLENRVWENFSSLPETRPELALQVLEPQQEIWVLIYDPASGSTVWTKFDPEGLFWSAVITGGFAAFDTYQYATGQISGAEYAGAMALNGAALLADVATAGQGGGLAVRAANVGLKVAKAVDKADTLYSTANGAVRTAESIAEGDGLGAVVNGGLTAIGAKNLELPGGKSAKANQEETAVRVQHATSNEGAEQILKDQKIDSTSQHVYGQEAQKPGEVKSKQELLDTGASAADKVVEFDVKPSEMRKNDIGDVTLPKPVDLTKRNPKVIDVPEKKPKN